MATKPEVPATFSSTPRRVLGASILALLLPAAAFAGDVNWNVSNGLWTIATNWLEGHAPLANDNGIINNGGIAVLATGQGASVQGLVVARGTGTGNLIIDGGTMASAFTIIGGDAGSSGSITLNSGVWQNGGNGLGLVVGAGGIGTLNLNGGAVTTDSLSLAVVAGSSGTFNFNGGVLLTSQIKKGSGTATLNLNGGLLRASAATGDFIQSNANLLAGGALIDSNGFAITVGAVLQGAGALVKLGAGNLTLTGLNTYSGGTTIADGNLIITNATALGSTGTITFSGGALAFANSTAAAAADSLAARFSTAAGQVYRLDAGGNTVTINNSLNTAGSSLVLQGNGVLVLKGSNSFPAGVTLSGTAGLSVGSANALGSSGPITFNGGFLGFNPASAASADNIFSRFSTAGGQNYVVDGGASNLAVSSSLNAPGSSLTFRGSGTLALTGSNSFPAGVTLSGSTVLSAGGTNALGTVGPITFSGGALGFTSASVPAADNLFSRFSTAAGQSYLIDPGGQGLAVTTSLNTSAASLTLTGTGALTMSGDSQFHAPFAISVPAGASLSLTGQNLFSGVVTLSGASSAISLTGPNFFPLGLVVSGSTSVTLANQNLSGGLGVSGSATVKMTGPNSVTGGVDLTGGTLSLQAAGALSDFGPSGAIGFSGGTLAFTAASVADATALLAHFSTTAGTNAYRIDTAGQDVTFSSPLTGSGSLAKLGTGTLILATANTYTGPTSINSGGVLFFAKRTAFYNGNTAQWTAGNLTVAGGNVAEFAVGGPGEFAAADIVSIASLGTASGGFQSTSGIGFDTTNAPGGNFTLSGPLTDPNGGANALAVVKYGTGTLTLTGANTYQGDTHVRGGTLKFGGGVTSNIGNNITLEPGAQTRLEVADGAVVQLNGANPTVNIGNSMSGSGTDAEVTVSGSGSRLTANFIGSGRVANIPVVSDRAWLTINNGGTVQARSSTFGISTVSGGSTLYINGGDFGISVDGAGSSFTVTSDLILALKVSASMSVTGGGSVTADTLNFARFMGRGTAAVTVSGAGSSLTLTSIFDGAFTVAGGLVGDSTADISVNLKSGGSITAPGAIQLTGTFTGTAPGPAVLLNIGDYNLSTTGGTLNVPGIFFGKGNGVVNFNQTDTLTFAPVMDSTHASVGTPGPGTVNQRGSGTTLLIANNTYSGTTNVTNGKLLANNPGVSGSATGTSVVTVSGAGTLGGTGRIAGVTTIQTGGTLAPGSNAVGLLTFADDLTLQGGSTTAMELGGLTLGNYDRLSVDDVLTYGGTLSLSFVNGYAPAPGHSFQLFQDFNSESGTFNAISFSNPGVSGSFDYTTGTLTLLTVPEPASGVLAAGSVLGFLAARRRRRR